MHHVDVVHVLNHGSEDQTAYGLELLKEIWGERLVVYTAAREVPFNQSSLTNMIASFAEQQGADWIYVFDSDEFMLTPPNVTLRELLSNLPDSVLAARYQLSNFVSTHDFDTNSLDCYLKLMYKARPSVRYDPKLVRDLMYTGRITFFDVPFPPKLIFRARAHLMITDGAHALKWSYPNRTVQAMPMIYCAHLTLPSRKNLLRKSALGQVWVKAGLPADHGWQNQLLYRLELEERLEWFWRRHSINDQNQTSENPRHELDDSLVRALAPVIEFLKLGLQSADLSVACGRPIESRVKTEEGLSFSSLLALCESYEQKIAVMLKAQAQAQAQAQARVQSARP
jgi:hypothetical protein